MRILLMGPPASGKGTVGEKLSEKLNLPLVSAGKILREIPENDPLYVDVHKFMDKGELVSNKLLGELLNSYLSQTKFANGYILDGWGRQLTDFDYFDPEADIVLFINISDETAIKRISGRRVCSTNDHICNIFTVSLSSPNSCDLCEGELIQRDDDKKEVVEQRLKIYHNLTVPSINHFKDKGNLIEINGEGTPEEVLDLVLKSLPKA